MAEQSKPLPPTISFPLPILHPKTFAPRWRKRAVITLGVLGLLLAGVLLGYGLRVWHVLQTEPDLPSPPAEAQTRVEPPRGTLCPGIAVIEDSTVLSVTNNRAAVASKHGFTIIPYGEYTVTSYAVSADGTAGMGMAGDALRFSFVWVKGENPPPRTLRTLEFVSGRRVAAR